MIPLLLYALDRIGPVPQVGADQVLGNGSFDAFNRRGYVLLGHGREVSGEEGVVSEVEVRRSCIRYEMNGNRVSKPMEIQRR